ncbi:histone H2A [Mucor velutinosus]|uniref:Histone H2A n=1 Tax=Mucor velutinosus TaxID=708070 RepID=A0AAN7DFY5_9FUNG|nr:histone H2A [Mucor velutinosus]
MLIIAGFAVSDLIKITTERDGGARALSQALGQYIFSTTGSEKLAIVVISVGGDVVLLGLINGLSYASVDVVASGS